jgi:hypothetical protein
MSGKPKAVPSDILHLPNSLLSKALQNAGIIVRIRRHRLGVNRLHLIRHA